jgi:hypothetical protein
VLSEYAYSLSTTCFTSHAAGDIKLAARFFAATAHGARGLKLLVYADLLYYLYTQTLPPQTHVEENSLENIFRGPITGRFKKNFFTTALRINHLKCSSRAQDVRRQGQRQQEA